MMKKESLNKYNKTSMIRDLERLVNRQNQKPDAWSGNSNSQISRNHRIKSIVEPSNQSR